MSAPPKESTTQQIKNFLRKVGSLFSDDERQKAHDATAQLTEAVATSDVALQRALNEAMKACTALHTEHKNKAIHELCGQLSAVERLTFLRNAIVSLTFPERVGLLERSLAYLIQHTDEVNRRQA
eukprot:1966478-Pleurochrysis_carterae.AAC.1